MSRLGLYIQSKPTFVGRINMIGTKSSRTRRNLYPSVDTSQFITTVINRMYMPEPPTISKEKEKTEFKLTFDQFYRVILHYSNWPEDANKSVAKRLKMGVPVITMKDSELIVKQTFKYGICIVCTVQQDKAELYRAALVQLGLNATIEEA